MSSNDSAVMIAKLELRKMDEKKKLRGEKQRIKDLETPEEKRARRVRKKQVGFILTTLFVFIKILNNIHHLT